MPVFEYTALNRKGSQVSGFIDAGSMKLAKLKLRSTRIFPISITEVDTPAAAKGRQVSLLLHTRISAADTAAMTRQLATLVVAGFPLITALNTILPQIRKPSLKRVLSRVKDGIEEGNSFADSLARHPGVFSTIYINMVRAGEASGTLGIVLERLADISEKQNRMNRKIQSVLTYPVLMALIGTGILFFLLTVIVPNITAIFDDMNHTLPLATQLLISSSRMLQQWWWAIFGIVILLWTGGKMLNKKPAVQMAVDIFILKVPGLGDLVRKIAVARFARTLGALLENGVSLLEALAIVQNIVDNKVLEAAIIEAAGEVERGSELGRALEQRSCLPFLSVQMIQVGERSGNLAPMLKKTAVVYDEEIETTITGITSLLEPVIILVMAVVVGFIVLAICLPIFEMNQLVG